MGDRVAMEPDAAVTTQMLGDSKLLSVQAATVLETVEAGWGSK